MARDRMKLFAKSPEGQGKEMSNSSQWSGELKACFLLQQAMQKGAEKGLTSSAQQQGVWDENYKQVYGLAEQVMQRIIAEF
jgi:hypothetical protein